MDINTKIAKDFGMIPTRYFNQLDDTRSIQEKYIEAREFFMSEYADVDEEETTAVHITMERKNS